MKAAPIREPLSFFAKELASAWAAIMLAAVDRATFRWSEGYLGRLAAGGACSIEHLSIATAPTAAARTASHAAGALATTHLSKAVTAVDRALSSWLEGHLRGLVTIRARGVKHLTPHGILVHSVVTAFREEIEVGLHSLADARLLTIDADSLVRLL